MARCQNTAAADGCRRKGRVEEEEAMEGILLVPGIAMRGMLVWTSPITTDKLQRHFFGGCNVKSVLISKAGSQQDRAVPHVSLRELGLDKDR